MLGVALFEWIDGKVLAHPRPVSRPLRPGGSLSSPAFSSFTDRPATVLMTHSMAFIVIILAFLSREFVQTHKKGREARTN